MISSLGGPFELKTSKRTAENPTVVGGESTYAKDSRSSKNTGPARFTGAEAEADIGVRNSWKRARALRTQHHLRTRATRLKARPGQQTNPTAVTGVIEDTRCSGLEGHRARRQCEPVREWIDCGKFASLTSLAINWNDAYEIGDLPGEHTTAGGGDPATGKASGRRLSWRQTDRKMYGTRWANMNFEPEDGAPGTFDGAAADLRRATAAKASTSSRWM